MEGQGNQHVLEGLVNLSNVFCVGQLVYNKYGFKNVIVRVMGPGERDGTFSGEVITVRDELFFGPGYKSYSWLESQFEEINSLELPDERILVFPAKTGS